MSDINGTIQGQSVLGKVNIANVYEGFSPVAKVEETDDGAVVTITDKKGTTSATIKHGTNGKDGADGKSAYIYAKESGYSGTEEEFAKILSNMYSKEDIDNIVKEITYEPISISSFKSSVTTAELGSTVDAVTLSWELNKAATTLTIDDEEQDASTSSKAMTGLGITSNKTWELLATDEKGAIAYKTAALSFLNGAYYGVAGATDTYDSAFILALTKTLTSTKTRTFTASAGTDEYIYYCVPSRFGECSFNVGGFDGGFDLVATIQFTNASGYTEEYLVYKSANASLGSTAVKVS